MNMEAFAGPFWPAQGEALGYHAAPAGDEMLPVYTALEPGIEGAFLAAGPI